MADDVATGGTGMKGAELKRLRRARHGEAANTERLLSGRAWSEFCRSLEAAGQHLAAFAIPDSPELRAEAYRYLLGLVTSGIGTALQIADPDHPRIWRNPDSFAKWGAEIRVVPGNYDDAVREAQKQADANGWFVVSDTSYPGYTEVPRDVMQGYLFAQPAPAAMVGRWLDGGIDAMRAELEPAAG